MGEAGSDGGGVAGRMVATMRWGGRGVGSTPAGAVGMRGVVRGVALTQRMGWRVDAALPEGAVLSVVAGSA